MDECEEGKKRNRRIHIKERDLEMKDESWEMYQGEENAKKRWEGKTGKTEVYMLSEQGSKKVNRGRGRERGNKRMRKGSKQQKRQMRKNTEGELRKQEAMEKLEKRAVKKRKEQRSEERKKKIALDRKEITISYRVRCR